VTKLGHNRILVAIETDATRFHGEHASRPARLGKGAAEQVLAHMSTDLSEMLPGVRDCALTMAGALYDQTQLLRPQYPLFSALESLFTGSMAGSGFHPRLLSIGADEGHFPDRVLDPIDSIPPSVLQVLPLLVSGPVELLDHLADDMEHQFLESGQLSAHSARALEAQFSIKVNHARFMTLTDLNAMLHLQLEHFGFLPLWDLLDAAINAPQSQIEAEGRGGQAYHWNGEAVRARFESFDYWATRGAGHSCEDDTGALAEGYTDWTREYRQYLTTLQAHGVPVEQYLPDSPEQTLQKSFHIEVSHHQPASSSAQVTEHSAGDLGTVAVSVLTQGKQLNYYPLEARGLDRLHAAITESLGKAEAVSFPGSLQIDAVSRCLVPDRLKTG